jgi:polyribonucleotide nucleotidyltransferase
LVSDRLDSWVVDRTKEKESSEVIFDSKFIKIIIREEEREDKSQKSVKALISVLAKSRVRKRIDSESIRIDSRDY